MPLPLPHIIYVYQEEDGKDKYLIARKNAFEVATLETSRIVGIYKLEKLIQVEAVPKVTDYKRKKK